MESVQQLGSDLQATKYYFTALTTLVFYDYLLTLPDEIRYAWSANRTSVLFIFFFNRYFSLASSIFLMFTYFSPTWTFEICNRFAVGEWVITFFFVIPAEMTLTLRVYALAGRKKAVLALLVPVLLVHFAFAMYVVSQPGNTALLTPPNAIDAFHVCILFPTMKLPQFDFIFLAISLAFDSTVFGLTMYSTLMARAKNYRTPVLLALQRDGILYFFVIFSGNLLWMNLILHARPGLKFMNAIPSLFMTSIMINRLNLSLRKAGSHQSQWGIQMFERRSEDDSHQSSSGGSTVGMLHVYRTK